MARGKSHGTGGAGSATISLESRLWNAADRLCKSTGVAINLAIRGLSPEQADTNNLHPDPPAVYGLAP